MCATYIRCGAERHLGGESMGTLMQAGNFLYGALTLLCSPLVCSQYWLLPMFLWACLLITSWQQLRIIT